MTSEIRTNSIKSRTGLSTVSYADTGIIVSGIVTATSFSGDSSNLTGLVSVANQADNRLITATGTTNALNGEANLIFDGTKLGIGGNPDVDFHIKSAAPTIRFTDTDTNRFSQIYAVDGNLRFDADNSNAQADTNIIFRTDNSERLRIASDGNMGLGTNSLVGNAANVYLTVNGSTLGGIALKANGATQGYLQGTSSLIRLSSDGAKPITFDTNGSERLRITSGGKVNIGGDYTQTSYNLSVTNTGGNLLRIKTANEGDYDLRFMIQNSEANIWHYGTDDLVFGNRYDRKLHFITNGSKRLTINGNLVGINNIAPQTGLHINQDWVTNYGSVSIEGGNNALVGIGLRNSGTYRASLIHRDGSSGDFLELTTIGSGRPILLKSNNTERLRIDDSGVKVPYGNVLTINKTSPSGNFYQEIIYTAGQKGCLYLENHAYYSNQPPLRINNIDTNNVRAMEDVQFQRAGGLVGYIRISAGSVTYSTSGSDERLKKNFETWNEEVLPDFKTLSPKLFNWIGDDDGTDKIKGFVAQDNLDKFPEAYNLTTSTDRYYFNPSGMVHYLMKAMQEAAIKIEKLEQDNIALRARVTNLEGN